MTMRAAFYEGHQKIRIGEGSPVAPSPGQVRIRVSHCGICGTDLHLFHGTLDSRVRQPHVMGHEMSGVVDVVGEGVTGWKAGDRVAVRPLEYCGTCPACRAGHEHVCHTLKVIGVDLPGAMQGTCTVPARTLHALPESLSLEHGALVEPLAVACHDVRLGEVASGENVVVLGAGPIGVLIGLVSRLAGARVILSEVNPFRRRLAERLGLETVDPREVDLPGLVDERTGGAGADVVFEVSGSAAGAESMTALPRVRGRIVIVAIHAEVPRVDVFRVFFRELRIVGARVYEGQDFEKAIRVAASGALPLRELITNVMPLEGLESALHQMESGGEVMKVLIRCSE
jgi:(R,R)-butanediol dehydrogenase/meso-butanediol dehydrogenase/diacetyl reductase